MKKSDHSLKIREIDNGFVIKDNKGNETVVQENEDDELSAAEELLNQIIEFFNLRGNPFGHEQLRIVRELGDEYTPQKGEKVVRLYYSQVARKQNAT